MAHGTKSAGKNSNMGHLTVETDGEFGSPGGAATSRTADSAPFTSGRAIRRLTAASDARSKTRVVAGDRLILIDFRRYGCLLLASVTINAV